MSSPFYLFLRGTFLVRGKRPDGDSLRFVADNPRHYRLLQNAHRLHPSKDGSLQLRLEGIDAPELHYGSFAQPLGTASRDRLLELMGLTDIRYAADAVQIEFSQPENVRGAILSKAADPNGRPIAYVLLDTPDTADLRDGQWANVNAARLSSSINGRMLSEGMAYYLVYTSTPYMHRMILRDIALSARKTMLGIWARDTTEEFALNVHESIGASGQLIMPKLFRRCSDYLSDVQRGFRGDLGDWLSTVRPRDDDRVVVRESLEVRFSSLLIQKNRRIGVQADILDLAFIEK